MYLSGGWYLGIDDTYNLANKEKIEIYQDSEKFNVHYNWINISADDVDAINDTLCCPSK